MNHKGSHPLIRNTYNFETAHQKQTREAARHQDPRMHPSTNLPLHTPHHKFAHSIQQLQSKIEGVESMVKAKGNNMDGSGIDK
jgi:hypothetical protein